MQCAKQTLIAAAALAALLAASPPVHADDRDEQWREVAPGSRSERHDHRGDGHDRDRRHHRRGDDDRRWREDDRHGRDRHWHDRSYDGRWDDHRRWREPPRGSYYDRDRDSRHWYRDRHGWSPYDRRVHRWKRGARLPPPYLTGRYVLRDYGYYRLRPPPRGAHWVRVGPDLVLASIATGIVIDVLHGYFR